MPLRPDPGGEGIGHFIEVRQAAFVIDEEALGANGAGGAGGQAGFAGLAWRGQAGLRQPVVLLNLQVAEVACVREVAAQAVNVGDVGTPVGGQAVTAQALEGQVGLSGQVIPAGLQLGAQPGLGAFKISAHQTAQGMGLSAVLDGDVGIEGVGQSVQQNGTRGEGEISGWGEAIFVGNDPLLEAVQFFVAGKIGQFGGYFVEAGKVENGQPFAAGKGMLFEGVEHKGIMT